MNTNNEETFYQAIRRKGVNRYSFLKYCNLAIASLGLGAGMTPRIAWALENKSRVPVIWIHGLECTCYTESFIRSSHPLVKDVILSLISLDYDDTLMATAGTQAEEVFEDILHHYHSRYILAVEGNPPLSEQEMLCINNGRPFIEKLEGATTGTSAIITWGTCASWGCVQVARPNPTQATPIDKVVTDKPIAKVPGCPPIPDIIGAIVTYMVTFDRLPKLDRLGRPLMFYDQYIHNKCYRHAHFDAGELTESWDDDATHEGYCLCKMDYKRPTAYNACSTTRWNGGIPFPIQSSHDCPGCSENGFWDRGPFYSHAVDIPQAGTRLTADTVDLTALGVVTTGVGVHTVASTASQHNHHR